MASVRALPRVLLALLAVGVAGTPWPGAAQVEGRTQLGWLRNGEFAPILVAEAKGFFTDEGIRHRIMDGGPGKNPVPIVGAGQATFGITAGGNVIFQARVAPDPIDVVAVGTLLQRHPYAFITLAAPGDPGPRPKDLEGRVFGMQANGDIFLKAFAKKHSVDLAKVKVEIVQANAEPLLVGRVDFFTGWVTNQTFQIEQEAAKADALPRLRGKTWKAMLFSEWAVPSYADVLVATAAVLWVAPALVVRDQNAVFKRHAAGIRAGVPAGQALPYLGDHSWAAANPLLYYVERELAPSSRTAPQAVADARRHAGRLLLVTRRRLPEVLAQGRAPRLVLEAPDWVLLRLEDTGPPAG
jgi:ABC-type nitrate/sulfonate/bicarbonate transport system substrate-binding protein